MLLEKNYAKVLLNIIKIFVTKQSLAENHFLNNLTVACKLSPGQFQRFLLPCYQQAAGNYCELFPRRYLFFDTR